MATVIKKTIQLTGLQSGDDVLKIACQNKDNSLSIVEIPIKVIGIIPNGRLVLEIEYAYTNASGNMYIFKLLSSKGSIANERNVNCYICDKELTILKTHIFDVGSPNISGGFTFYNGKIGQQIKYECYSLPKYSQFYNTNRGEGFLVPTNARYFIIV